MRALPDLLAMTALDLAATIRSRRASCREVMAATLDHIDAVDAVVNAIPTRLDRGVLLAAADDADTALGHGASPGPLYGLPHAVKDLSATRGIRTTMGSPLFANDVPAHDAIFVERLRAAGAILIGKTNTPEFGFGGQTYNKVFGITRNAYDPTKTCGGSSGGAAVALALRMVPLADGSDFAGSLRNPAGWNNVYGFRPTPGRVPGGPAPEAFLQQFGVEGPMARNVSDLALLLSVMAGPDPRAPLSLAEPPDVFAAPLTRDVTGLKIGWLGDMGGLPMEAGMLDLCLDALRSLEDAGCVIEDAAFGLPRAVAWDALVTLRHGLTAGRFGALYHDPAKRAQMKAELIWEIEGGLRLSAVDFYAASVERTRVYEDFRTLFERYDILVLPSAQVFPFDAELTWPRTIAGVEMDTYHRWMEVMIPATMAGCPAACVPAGFGPGGLPSGLQLIGPRGKDLRVLQVAYAYEQAMGARLAKLPALIAGEPDENADLHSSP